MKHLVPENFVVPLRLETAEFILRPLLITDVVKDYDAVMTSIVRLHGVFGERSSWPPADLSLEQDLIDLGWHHKEFQKRTSFAHTMMSPDESQCLGCTYIYPTDRAGYGAEAFCWVRTSHAEALDEKLFASFKAWLQQDWPFERVAFPGREPSWAAWSVAPRIREPNV